MTRGRRITRPGLTVGLVLLLAACGGDAAVEADDAASAGSSTTVTETSSPAADPAADPDPAPEETATSAPATTEPASVVPEPPAGGQLVTDALDDHWEMDTDTGQRVEAPDAPFADLAWIHIAPGETATITAQWREPSPDGHQASLSGMYGDAHGDSRRIQVVRSEPLAVQILNGTDPVDCPAATAVESVETATLQLSIPASCLELPGSWPAFWTGSVSDAESSRSWGDSAGSQSSPEHVINWRG